MIEDAVMTISIMAAGALIGIGLGCIAGLLGVAIDLGIDHVLARYRRAT